MISEIFVEGKKLDLTAAISSLLTFAIDDVKNFSKRTTTFSKSIVLPGTGNNNAIFGNIFDTGISNEYDPSIPNIGYNFNASKSARCYIFQDNIQTFKGTLRMIEIVKDRGRIEYEVALNGEITGLSVSLSSGLLTDLDFSSYNMFYTYANIVASWDNTPGSGVYFPLIDYGTYSTLKHDWDFRTFRPAFYVKEYIDKMFAAAGYTYECDLFNTDRFKSCIVPHNQKRLVKRSGTIFNAFDNVSQHIIDHTLGVNNGNAYFGSAIGGLFTSPDGKVFTYTGTDTIAITLTGYISGTYNFDAIPPSFSDYIGSIYLRKNGVNYSNITPLLTDNSGTSVPFYNSVNIPITLATGDTFSIFVELTNGPAGPADVYLLARSLKMESTSLITTPVDYNEEIDMNMALPQNIRQVDFLVSIVQLWNLYVYEDKWDEKKIIISPFVDFYNGTAVDWTYKLDRKTAVKIKPMSEVNSKIYNFNYRDDSDYYNELYKKRYNQGYGSHIFDSEFEFASQTNSLEIIFAPTPLVGYVGEDKIYSTIFKRTGTDTVVEETIDSVIRILQTKKKFGVDSWSMKNGATVLGSLTTYGYAGHFDDPDNPDNDLNFGILKEWFYELKNGDLTNTQFNLYWSAYMAEITNKDSKLMIGKFYLTPKDIFNLDFRTYVFVDGVLWRLNKISDYNASKPALCTVELLRVINNSYGFPPGAIPGNTPGNQLLWKDGDPILWDSAGTDELLYS